jgi:hypothetical protein
LPASPVLPFFCLEDWLGLPFFNFGIPDPRLSALIRGKIGGSVFRSPDVPITRSPDLFAPLCLRPSARDPTPHSALLKTKAKPEFDKTVTRLSMPFFPVFQGFNPAQFQPDFSVFTVRSAEGYKLQKDSRCFG